MAQVQAPEVNNLKRDIEDAQEEIVEHEVKLAHMVVKARYLQYIGSKDQAEGQTRDDCIICLGSSDDEDGVILSCGHFYCQVHIDLIC